MSRSSSSPSLPMLLCVVTLFSLVGPHPRAARAPLVRSRCPLVVMHQDDCITQVVIRHGRFAPTVVVHQMGCVARGHPVLSYPLVRSDLLRRVT